MTCTYMILIIQPAGGVVVPINREILLVWNDVNESTEIGNMSRIPNTVLFVVVSCSVSDLVHMLTPYI